MAKLDSTTVYGNLNVIGNLIPRQSIVTCAGTTTIDFNTEINFYISVTQSFTFALTNIASNVGKQGLIILVQNSSGGWSFTKAAEMKTPLGGATITQVTTANTVSILTYYILSPTFVIINYIGNFA